MNMLTFYFDQCFFTSLVHVQSRNQFRDNRSKSSSKPPKVNLQLRIRYSSNHILVAHVVQLLILALSLLFCRVRFHYGHPDIFDRIFHLTRGGISKASKTINLSEDIFSGNTYSSSST